MSERHVPEWLTQWEYAHRGLHREGVPENSLAAADGAIAAGMGIECDIQMSADNVPMVFHDWDVARLTGEAGATGQRTASELEQLCLVGTDQHPLSLSTLLELAAGHVPLLIEIKSRRGHDVGRTCASVRHVLAGYGGPHAVMSFDPRVARWFRRHSPKTCAGLVMREDDRGNTQTPWQRRLALWIARPDFLAYHVAALPSRWVAGLRARGLPVLTWTVNSAEARVTGLAHADALIAEGAGLA